MITAISHGDVSIAVPGEADRLWSYMTAELAAPVVVAAPVLAVDGEPVVAAITVADTSREQVAPGIVDHRVIGALRDCPELVLAITFRIATGSPVVRFSYRLTGAGRLTKGSGADQVCYLRTPLADCRDLYEVRLSEFFHQIHSYNLTEAAIEHSGRDHDKPLIGPIITAQRGPDSLLIAYEHGSQVPNGFLAFRATGDDLALEAVKGNYLDQQLLPYETVWFQLAGVHGDRTDLANAYRDHLLHHHNPYRDNAQIDICYNTWALQERARWQPGGKYLDPMTEDRILQEVEVAHQIGIDTFVIDTGWYAKTGDWEVNTERFGESLGLVGKRLAEYDMRLGLWFGPCDAAITSRAVLNHPEYQMSVQGIRRPPTPVWETEESVRMCLVSPYADQLAAELIKVAEQTGVQNFKWDAVDQYGCDDPGHWHGNASHTAQERADSYAYQLPLVLTRIAQQVSRAVPGATVDFDVTEPGRSVGLAFLAAGRYFLINNGPYYANYNVPNPAGYNPNVYVFPGPARARVCRAVSDFDEWIPLSLFLTHYLPDDPVGSQLVNVASMMTGQHGIWGDLAAVSPSGIELLRTIIDRYKDVARDAVRARSLRRGLVGGSPEIHEKVLDNTGRGVVVLFAPHRGTYRYTTAARVHRRIGWDSSSGPNSVSISLLPDGRADIAVTLDTDGAAMIFFG